MNLTKEQREVLKAIMDWVKAGRAQSLTLGGYAGAGETTLLGVFRLLMRKGWPKAKIAFCAYTGKASRVLKASLIGTNAIYEGDSVSTIHGLIYAPIVHGGRVGGWTRKEKLTK